jgi:phosphomannomutase
MKPRCDTVEYFFDPTACSYRFAKLTAGIFANAKFRVYLYADVTPTPFVPFGMRIMKAAVGVMVTASHNPKDDNGYKVYWENFTQVYHVALFFLLNIVFRLKYRFQKLFR